jgi:hypothetical protein
VTGPGGFTRTVVAAETIADLPVGQYTVAAGEALNGEDRYAASPATQTVNVARGATATASVAYSIASGSILITFSGLPSGAQGNATIAGPAGYSRAVTSGGTVGGLAPGSYTLTAANVDAEGHAYRPANAQQIVQVSASATAVPVSLSWAIATGAITASIEGLPAGMTQPVQVTGPGGFSRTVAANETITGLAPGTYSLTGAPVTAGADQYRVETPTQVQVTPSATPQTASVRYAITTGRLAVSFSGIPAPGSGTARVTGPGNFQRNVSGSETLTGLVPGTYTVTPNDITVSGVTYGSANGAAQVVVSASSVPATASFAYTITRGSLSVIVNGLPQSIPAQVTVTGPENFSQTVATTTVLSALKPGTYTILAASTPAGVHVYAASNASQQVTVGASAVPAQATVTYSLASGLMSLTVNGLPQTVFANITVTGPGGFSRTVTATSLLTGLTPGAYTIAAGLAQSGSSFWAPNPANQTVTVPATTSAIQATVTYATANGSLQVNISGLPGGTNAAVTITGPNSFSQVVTATTTLNGLLQGGYTVAAATVTNAGATYTATPATQIAVVGGGVTSSVNVTYTQTGGPPPPPAPLNLTIDGMHVQQVVQNYGGTVPLVAGKDGLLRVFVKATSTNTATPTVRVRLYNGAVLQSTLTITAPGSSVPTSVSQATLAGSWNVIIPGSLMQPGLKVLADVDPTNTVTESSEGDNAYPVSGSAQTMDVRTLPAFDVRFVPVAQSINGLTGGVTAGNAGSYLSWTTRLFPTSTVNLDVRSTYTTGAPPLQDDDGNGAWSQILSELNALRTADGSTKYYAGIARVNYFSGIAGLGYVPGRATLSWDYLPSASEVVAHEVGHNFGRFHAPCGGAGGPDPGYPYAGGQIGVYGYDMAASTLKAPTLTDLMGYCNNNWISDYTYTAVFNYRIANPYAHTRHVLASNMTARRGLLVWGRVHRGQVILEPAFEVVAPPALPPRDGPFRLQAWGPLGESLVDLSFEGERIADHPDPTARHFAFVVPLDAMRNLEASRIQVSGLGRTAERRAGAAATGYRTAPGAQREGQRGVRISHGDPQVQGVLVRDPRTGEILSFQRGGVASLVSQASELDVVVSDGVRSATSRVRVGQGPTRR